MDDERAVLFANEAFYRAFADGDAAAMDEVWARHARVACIHPGWAPLDGRQKVIESWAAIFGNPNAPEVACRDPAVTVLGDVAYVVCFEQIGRNFLVATNIFVREDGLWRMVLHQAGPTSGEPKERAPKPGAAKTLH